MSTARETTGGIFDMNSSTKNCAENTEPHTSDAVPRTHLFGDAVDRPSYEVQAETYQVGFISFHQ